MIIFCIFYIKKTKQKQILNNLFWKLTQLLDQYIKAKTIKPSNDMLKWQRSPHIYTPFRHSNVWLHAEKSNRCIKCWWVVCLCLYAGQTDMHMVFVLMQIHNACYFIVPFHSLIDVGLLCKKTDWFCLTPTCLCSQVYLWRSGPFYKLLFMGSERLPLSNNWRLHCSPSIWQAN